jgi:heme exporter protein D
MYWNSFSEFLAMGNHGVYVWGSVIVMAVAMIVEPLLLINGQKSLVARLKRQFRAESREKFGEKLADQGARHTSSQG